jgi:cell division protein FtsL
MPDSDLKLPVGIVNTVITKIADFTKEIEILRAQLPDKTIWQTKLNTLDDKLSIILTNLNQKVDKTFTTIKTVFVLTMIAVGLIFAGSQLLTWYESKQTMRPLDTMAVELKKEISKERAGDLDILRKERAKDLKKIIEEIHDLEDRIDKNISIRK